MECATDSWEGFGHSNYLKDFGGLGTGRIGDIYIWTPRTIVAVQRIISTDDIDSTPSPPVPGKSILFV